MQLLLRRTSFFDCISGIMIVQIGHGTSFQDDNYLDV